MITFISLHTMFSFPEVNNYLAFFPFLLSFLFFLIKNDPEPFIQWYTIQHVQHFRCSVNFIFLKKSLLEFSDLLLGNWYTDVILTFLFIIMLVISSASFCITFHISLGPLCSSFFDYLLHLLNEIYFPVAS